jgi:hypothetical protein
LIFTDDNTVKDTISEDHSVHRVESTPYGFKIMASGLMNSAEAEELRGKLLSAIKEFGRPFSLLVDVRELIPADPDALDTIREIQTTTKDMNLERAAIVVSSPVLKNQAVRVSFGAATRENDRFIDAAGTPDWQEKALGWVEKGIEPENKLSSPKQI